MGSNGRSVFLGALVHSGPILSPILRWRGHSSWGACWVCLERAVGHAFGRPGTPLLKGAGWVGHSACEKGRRAKCSLVKRWGWREAIGIAHPQAWAGPAHYLSRQWG